eukprot:EG_transcript_25900
MAGGTYLHQVCNFNCENDSDDAVQRLLNAHSTRQRCCAMRRTGGIGSVGTRWDVRQDGTKDVQRGNRRHSLDGDTCRGCGPTAETQREQHNPAERFSGQPPTEPSDDVDCAGQREEGKGQRTREQTVGHGGHRLYGGNKPKAGWTRMVEWGA